MSSWLVDFMVRSDIGLEPNTQLWFSDPITEVRIFVSSWDSQDYQADLLSFKVVVKSADAQTAEQEATARLNSTLDLITGFTGVRSEINRVGAVYDWTPGVTPRKGYVRTGASGQARPMLAADKVLPEIEKSLHGVDILAPARRALRWLRKGVIEPEPFEQFIFFWTALEIIANLLKPSADIDDLCPRCRKPLGACPHCGELLKHRPYPTQAIRQLVCERLGKSPEYFEKVQRIRHAYVHGDDLDTFKHDIVEASNDLGLTVLGAFHATLVGTAGAVRVLVPTTLSHTSVSATVNISYEPDRDDLQNPDPAKIRRYKAELQVTRRLPGEEGDASSDTLS